MFKIIPLISRFKLLIRHGVGKVFAFDMHMVHCDCKWQLTFDKHVKERIVEDYKYTPTLGILEIS